MSRTIGVARGLAIRVVLALAAALGLASVLVGNA
jgi:hypothetical protein